MAENETTPPYFLCPISLRIMDDPVTLITGITYNRRSIERWFNIYHHDTCPVTKQQLSDQTLTPNSNLLRLIHSYTATKPNPTTVDPCLPISIADIAGDLQDPKQHLKCMAKIKDLIQSNKGDLNIRVCMAESGITSIVASLASTPRIPNPSLFNPSAVINEATSVLRLLELSPEHLKKVAKATGSDLTAALCCTVEKGSYRARIDSIHLLKSIYKLIPNEPNSPPPELFDGIIDALKDQNLDRPTTLAALSILIAVSRHARNRKKAVEAGAVAVLVELMLEEREDRKKVEGMLGLLSMLCGSEEGRLAVVAHPAGVAAVAEKVLKVSHFATEKAMKVLALLCRFHGSGRLVEEMMAVGAVAKVCMVVQVEFGKKARDLGKEIMGMHLAHWNNFPCFPNNCFL